MAGKALDQTSNDVAVLDEAVLHALGQLQGKYDAEFVARMITMFMETALILLIRFKEGSRMAILPRYAMPPMS